MSAAYEIGVNLTSAAIGAAAGLGWTYSANRFKYRHHRAFWRFLEKPTVFVVGDLEPGVLLGTLPNALEQVVGQEQDRQRIVDTIMAHLNTQEISGLIGRGDLDAIVNMVAKFASLRLPAETRVLHPSQVGERRNQNLVLIGGNDANSLTNALAPRLGCRLASIINDKGHNVVRDSRHNVDYEVTWQRQPTANGATVLVDYGILARGRNPYNLEHEVLLIAGAHGLGSLAAAEVSLSPKYEKRLYNDLKEYNGSFECLVRYKRVDGGPDDGQVTIDLEFSRGLDVPPHQP